ncbi:MAG: hypothetical protein JNN07_16565 [Verrucomicrobiales bacterium]|nr:hypothetical protein [Verrucomicrobiales bacterium]
MKTLRLYYFGLVCLLSAAQSFAASPPPWFFAPVVPKNLNETTEGAGATVIPFGTFPSPNFHECESCRFQQVIAASEFSEGPQENGFIYSILPRGDTCNQEGTSLDGVVIRLSTTSKEPDNLSLRFAENIGPDERVVLRGSVGVYGGGDCVGGPARFLNNWWILSNSFPYSPLKGNLLIDIEYSRKMPDFDRLGPTMDAQADLADGISMIYGCPNTAEVAKEALTTGLIFQFFIVRPALTVQDQADSILLKWSHRLPHFRLQAAQVVGNSLAWSDYGTEEWPNDLDTNYATLKKSALGDTRYFRLYSDSPAPSQLP